VETFLETYMCMQRIIVLFRNIMANRLSEVFFSF